MVTPAWIAKIVDANGGIWTRPQLAPRRGEVLLRRCMGCSGRIKSFEWFVLMPGVMGGGAQWVVWHRSCLLGVVVE